MDERKMAAAGFTRIPGARHAWRYRARSGRAVDLEIAALASSKAPAGPFSVAFGNARRRRIEGVTVSVPAVEDYVVLKLFAAADDPRRRARDLVDVQDALAAYPDLARTTLSIPGLRARLCDFYEVRGARLADLVALSRLVPR